MFVSQSLGEKMKTVLRLGGLSLAMLLAFGCSEDPAEPATVEMQPVQETQATAMVDDARIAAMETDEPGAWLTYGRNYEEQRFSPLTDINRETVSGLGIAWYKELDTFHPVEATPLIIDGVMYFTAPYNIVYAVDARDGEELWRYDPQVPGETARDACCGVINRGLAAYNGRIYTATLDGRLIALDAASGTPVWEVDTIIDRTRQKYQDVRDILIGEN